jgi:uncharacterized membrane protein required for colicin V production
MNVIDVVLVLLVIAIVVIEAKRGFGKVAFDFVALLVALHAASAAAPTAAASIHLAGDAPATQAIWVAILFLLLGALLIWVGKIAYQHTQFSLELFDNPLGGVLGIGVAVIVGHVLVSTLAISSGVGGAPPEVISGSTLGMEFYQFGAYHRVMGFLYTLGA